MFYTFQNDDSEEACFELSLNNILEAWILVVQNKKIFGVEKVIKVFSTQLFNKYLQCHLSPPDGIRTHDINNDCNQEIENTESSDRMKYEEPLMIIGMLGRQQPEETFPILCKLLEDRTRRLHGQLQRIYQSNNIDAGESKVLEVLYEDISWLVLIASHLVALRSVSEDAIVPDELKTYCSQRLTCGTTDITTTLKVLASPNQCITEIPNADATSDQVIRLVAAIFRLCEIETKAMEAKMTSILSPEVTANIMWFLINWSESYLLISDDDSKVVDTLYIFVFFFQFLMLFRTVKH